MEILREPKFYPDEENQFFSVENNEKLLIQASNQSSVSVKIEVDSDELDIAIEKANRLVELLREAQQIISSLSGREDTE